MSKLRTLVATLAVTFASVSAGAPAAQAVATHVPTGDLEQTQRTRSVAQAPANPTGTTRPVIPVKKVLGAQVLCEYRLPGGACMQAVCTTDVRSDCTAFKFACERAGGRYEGTTAAGRCSIVL